MRSMRSLKSRVGSPAVRGGGRGAAAKALAWPSAEADAQQAQIEAIEAELGVESPGPGSTAPYAPVEAGAKAWGL